MFIRIIFILIVLLVSTHSSWAQSIDECVIATSTEAKRLAQIGRSEADCPAGCSGCGCRGGPGYRNSKNECVGYSNLVSDCGPPLHNKCAKECYPAPPKCPKRRPPRLISTPPSPAVPPPDVPKETPRGTELESPAGKADHKSHGSLK